jgi:hypothetical protein
MNKLELFGKLISEDLRDSSLNRYMDLESDRLGSEYSKQLSKELSTFTGEQKKIIRKVLTASVDTGIHNFLFALEEERNGIKVMIDNENIAELSDGLQGEIYSSDGWFEKFSQHKENGI